MFNPRYNISPKLLENIKRVAVLIEEINNNKFPEVIRFQMEKSARSLSSYSSTSIEGNPLPLTEVKKILKQTPKHIRDTEREVLNYNKALEYLEKLAKKGEIEMNLPLVFSIQSMITESLIGEHHSGKIRNEPVFLNDPSSHEMVYLPPDSKDVLSMMKDLVSFVTNNERILDPLIVAGIFHKQFVIIHPFIDGNGRTTRLATKVLLARLGLDTFNLFSFENYYNKNVSQYFKKVGLYGNYYDLKETIDFTLWLEYFTDGIIDELLRVQKELQVITIANAPRIRPEYLILIEYIKKHGSINDKEYAKFTNRAKSTRALDFKNLLKLGNIERFEKGKNTYYRLKQ